MSIDTIENTEQHGEQAFRSTSITGREDEMTYSGVLSFLRRKYSRDLTDVDVVVSGVPYDCATSHRPGTRLGPNAIRAASVQLAELKAFPYGFDPFDHLAVIDYGDCFFDFGYPGNVIDVLQSHAARILDSGASMLTFGGDHFITYPLLRAHAEKYGPLSLVQFDAHCDTWPDDGERIDHGSMFLRAANEGLIIPERSVQIGLRTYNDDDHGFNIITSPWIHRNGIDATIEKVSEIIGEHQAYLTFDIDCLDPSCAPGTGTPVVGGLSTAQALEIFRGLEHLDYIGMDLVEVSPPFDQSEITAIAAATFEHDYLCMRASRKMA